MIVIGGDYGQLGNRLIVFANMIACARERGLRVANPAFHEYAQYFDTTRRDLWCRYPAGRTWWATSPRLRRLVHRTVHVVQRYAKKFRNRTKHWPPLLRVLDIGWRESCDLDGAEFLELTRRPGVLITKGWLFRARETFAQHAEAVRRFFTPAAAHRDNAAALMQQVRRDADVVVGVHIRQGDYREYLGGRFFYNTEQYVTVLHRVEELFADRDVAFLVCSNVAQPAAAFRGLNVTFGPNHLIEDMYGLAACDYVIGPPSTYTIWASFYGEVPLCIVADPEVSLSLTDFEVVRNFNRVTPEHSAVLAAR